MKHFTITILFTLFSSVYSYSQSTDQNSKRVDLGLGLVDEITLVGGNFDYAVADNIFVGFSGYLNSKEKLYSLFPTIKGSYYLNNLLNLPKDNLDLYAGLGVSKLFFFYSGFNTSSEIYFPVHAGGRYFFNDKLGIHAQITISNKVVDANIFNLGITIKK
jgi:hypothetical protein